MMTGPGTNTYLVGDKDLAVIDPGPAIDSHIAAVLAAGAGRIRWVLCTHTHMDHSPAAQAIKAATGAVLLGRPAPALPGQDASFVPDRVLEDGDRLMLSRPVAARAAHARPRVEPPVLPAREHAHAVHGRPRDAGLHRGDQPARRRHARLPCLARAAARRGHPDPRAGPRLPHRRAAPRGAAPDPPPPGARAEGGERARAPGRADAGGTGAARCTTTCPRACTAWRSARSPRTSASSRRRGACAPRTAATRWYNPPRQADCPRSAR